MTKEEMHAVENLRGIPKALDTTLHQKHIHKRWNKFRRENAAATKAQLELLRDEIDAEVGHLFIPPRGKNR